MRINQFDIVFKDDLELLNKVNLNYRILFKIEFINIITLIIQKIADIYLHQSIQILKFIYESNCNWRGRLYRKSYS